MVTEILLLFSGSSWFASVFLVVNAALGAGLLNFPQAYHDAGGVVIAVLIQAVSIANLSYNNNVFHPFPKQDLVFTCHQYKLKIVQETWICE